MAVLSRPLAIVTGASSGIGLELAKCCVGAGYDLVIVADEPAIQVAAESLRSGGANVDAVQADLATIEGNDQLLAAVRGRPVAALLANAGHGLGKAFLDQEWNDIRHVIDTNVTGTLYLVHRVGKEMRARGEGKILIVGSIQAVYNGTKAMIDSFAVALRHELVDSGVTVTCLLPGPTETEFFERADLMDTKVGTDKKMAADKVAKIGFDAMIKGDGDVIAGLKNKLQVLTSKVSKDMAAEQHRKLAEPGTARDSVS
jgi:short-subunit dehydrogenase